MLRRALEDLQPHLLAGTLVQGKPLKRCGSLVALGGRLRIGLRARPYFAARGTMKAQLERLSPPCVAKWQQRLRTPAQQRVRQVAFLRHYFPVPEGGREALRLGQRQPGRPQPGGPGAPPPPPASATAEAEAARETNAGLPTGLAAGRSTGGAAARCARLLHWRRSVPAARGPGMSVV